MRLGLDFELRLTLEPPVKPCVGCGYCCKKSPCFIAMSMGIADHGRCLALYWNGEMYRCRLIETNTSKARELFADEGCCSPLNSWRRDVRERNTEPKMR